MPNRQSRRRSRERHELAAEAARIIATEGQRSYLLAKHKAAERLGMPSRDGLPSNSEIEAALREWQQLYGAEDRAERLREMRQAALRAMRFLKPFQPKLVGPVLDGTADEFSRICLHVFSDDPDAVVRFLMEHGVPFEQERRRVRWHDGSRRHIDVLIVQADGEEVELAHMVGREARQALPSPIDGRPLRRGGLHDVEKLLDTE